MKEIEEEMKRDKRNITDPNKRKLKKLKKLLDNIEEYKTVIQNIIGIIMYIRLWCSYESTKEF